MNNRGQVFAFILVFITLFFCGMVWVFYGIQQDRAESSLVSPRAVLEMRDELEVFEMRERELISFLVEDIDGEFGSDEYLVEFRERFLNGTIWDGEMMEFIYDGLVFGGRDYEDEAMRLGEDFLSVNLYSDVVYEGGNLVFVRNKMGKRDSLRALDGGEDKIKFGVDFVFEFEREYVVGEDGGVL
jgi:hypothetical protein